ncbi:response regulator transcription factor [Bacillus cereus]|uniref:response regulator transcription factor n=1 Tax=Bacillus cereus TaxID=1396 RepID=UPI000BEBF648|nr:response regulator transcription factor [Bacillus cereus]PEE60884.1 DNA-binding response regulator [Bacillus cereus]PFB16338.1 DNA-binding response regulator [Bacillus cereus]PFC61781.1 DNA-binding response regulator [Bacillus cereus]PFD05333.1 DNA-binding response regulator [Bacillus cereus]PFW04172.1 DNA-binding response regulator [Bacillus cereus]
MIQVLIIDDHLAVGMGTKVLIEQENIQADVLFYSEKLQTNLSNKKYDVYMVDLYMPNLNGLEISKKILKEDPNARIIIYTGFDIEPHFNLLIETGVMGIISKTASQESIINAIESIMRKEIVIPYELFKQLRIQERYSHININKNGVVPISMNHREIEVLSYIEKGMTNKCIASTLNLSQRSIEYTITEIFNKLGVYSRVEAVKAAKKIGIISKFDL